MMELRWYQRQPWKFIVIVVLLCAAPASGFVIFGLLMFMYWQDFFPPPIPAEYLTFDGYEKPDLYRLKRRIRRRLFLADVWGWMAVFAFGGAIPAAFCIGKQHPGTDVGIAILFGGWFLATVFVMLLVSMRGLIPYLIAEYEYRMSESPYTVADNIPPSLTISGNDSPPDSPEK